MSLHLLRRWRLGDGASRYTAGRSKSLGTYIKPLQMKKISLKVKIILQSKLILKRFQQGFRLIAEKFIACPLRRTSPVIHQHHLLSDHIHWSYLKFYTGSSGNIVEYNIKQNYTYTNNAETNLYPWIFQEYSILDEQIKTFF